MRFCGNCGAEVEEDLAFCSECGSPIDDIDVDENQQEEDNSIINDSNSTENLLMKKKRHTFYIVCVMIVVVVLVLLYIVSNGMDGNSVKTKSPLTSEEVTEVTTEEVTTEKVTETTTSEPTTEEVTTEIATEEITTEEIVVEGNVNTYYNELFGYSMLIPEGFEIVEEFADNDVKDGVMLSDGSAQIEIRGSDYITINTASDVMEWANGNITWSDLGENYCCYSYDLNGALGYYGCYFDGNIQVYFNFQYIIDFQKDSYPSVAEELCEYVMNGNVVK